MGGKKKTKWRKLPLAEFTKECPGPPAVTKNEGKEEITKEDEETPPPVPSYEELAVNTNQYFEYGEYTDVSNMLYPTPYIVYNPVEMPVYPSYMMPPDACCYYYMPPPEMPQVEEYVSMPYQEYIPPVKDTVYLLLPAPAVRPTYGSSNVAYDLRNRRRRRRYEGYAEYAVIPEKTNYSANREERDRLKNTGSYANPSRNDNQSYRTKTMTSFSETNSFSRDGHRRVPESNEKKFITPGELIQTGKNVGLSQVERNEGIQEMQNLKPRKNQEICGVHTARTSEKKNFQNNSDTSFQEKQSKPTNSEWFSQESLPSTKESVEYQKQVQEITGNQGVTDNQKCQDTVNHLLVSKEMEIKQEKNTNNINDTGLESLQTDLKISKHSENSLYESAKKTEERNLLGSIQNSDSETMTASDNFVKISDKMLHQSKSETEKHSLHNPNEAESSSPLPDILSTLHKTLPSNPKTTNNDISNKNDKHSESPIFDKTPPPSEKFSKSKVILSQSPYISHSLNSDTSSHDSEAELKRLTNLQSLRANQSIYKLAYDESITDQSEADSRSPSPVDPETQVPRSIISEEILIHEADSCSDAGSEDVELIPHRYESETFLNESKHMYINKLSLAVELLRTQESLPYDEQFKRVSGESNLNLKETNPGAIGEVNLGFVEDSSSSFESFEGHTDNRIPEASHNVISSQSQTSKNSRNSAAVSSFSFEDACNESCEEAKEVVVEAANTRDNTEGVRAGYRRFQVQFRHYFTPRAALVNPCLCCVIM
ncbi:hypothetical protein HNY73_006274 [Argiope bruennichi]|uniref:Uncharacterized protein n=1 Tax=Argiope bruennichi TaxID=94029 RepID=A0A8T0FLM7_ARGBR|nr:hypothetical protein HNY73_006274 [Argiope bruennichi]